MGRMTSFAIRSACMALLLATAGCGDDRFSQNTSPASTDLGDPNSFESRRARGGSVLDIFGLQASVGPDRQRDPMGTTNVNRFLWRASLDTLSFLPIASTDPFTGVIATDWGTVTETDTERFRVTAFVTSAELTPESVRVAVYREVRQPNGAWVSAPVAAETPRQIEDSILLRARQLRVEERSAAG